MDAVVYKLTIAGRPYIGSTLNFKLRYRQHQKHAGKNPMYKQFAAGSPIEYEILYRYTGKSVRRKYIKQVIQREEIKQIRAHNSFLEGWNQTIGGEPPSLTLNKYILDVKLTKDKNLAKNIDWKLENSNIPGKIKRKLQSKLYEVEALWTKQ